MEKQEGIQIIREVVAECLALEPEAVNPGSRLVTDLGADSLDFLDIIFSLESRFNVRFRSSEFDFVARLDLSSPQVVRNGFLTPQTVDRLRPIFPALNEIDCQDHITPDQVFSLITVETLFILVEKHLGRRGDNTDARSKEQ